MYKKLGISVDEQKVKALPKEAVVRSGGSEYIFVQAEEMEGEHKEEEQVDEDNNDGQEKESEEDEEELAFRMIEVKTGISDLGYIEVIPLEKLDEETKIVVKGAFYLLSQMKNAEGGDDDDD